MPTEAGGSLNLVPGILPARASGSSAASRGNIRCRVSVGHAFKSGASVRGRSPTGVGERGSNRRLETRVTSRDKLQNTTVSTPFTILADRIASRSCTVGVIGLGYVGLPLIDAFVSRGISALGFDIDPAKITALNAGRSYIKHVSSEKVSQWRSPAPF